MKFSLESNYPTFPLNHNLQSLWWMDGNARNQIEAEHIPSFLNAPHRVAHTTVQMRVRRAAVHAYTMYRRVSPQIQKFNSFQ